MDIRFILENYFVCTKCDGVYDISKKAKGRNSCKKCYNSYKTTKKREENINGHNTK